jgi:hypothetical protein
VDVLSGSVGAAICCAFVASLARASAGPPPVPLAHICGMAFTCSLSPLLYALAPRWYLKHRTALVILVRLGFAWGTTAQFQDQAHAAFRCARRPPPARPPLRCARASHHAANPPKAAQPWLHPHVPAMPWSHFIIGCSFCIVVRGPAVLRLVVLLHQYFLHVFKYYVADLSFERLNNAFIFHKLSPLFSCFDPVFPP